ncbi:MAG: PKD domain-containing protein [Bacteroidetes bacterium]|nr:PKD domain-containing protein [Bacteroidota bacterium]
MTGIFSAGKAQLFPQLVFQKFYDNLGDDMARRLVKSTDGHLIIGGNTVMYDSTGTGCSNIWVIKVDTSGFVIWEREIIMDGCEELRDMIPTKDNGLMFTGVTTSLIPHDERGDANYWGDYFIGKVDEFGNVEWLESYGGSNLDHANGIVEGIYREYMIVGGSHSADNDVGRNYGMSDVWSLKLDSRGKPRSSKVLGTQESEWANAVAVCKNGDYLIAGYSNSSPLESSRLSPFGNGLLIRMNRSGAVLWEKKFPCPRGGYFMTTKEREDGKLMVAGVYESKHTGKDFWWLSLDSEGNRLKEVILNGYDDEYISRVEICSDQGSLFSGYSIPKGRMSEYSKGGEDFWMIRTSSYGEIVWKKTYGGPDDERCADALEYSPGVYYAVGEKFNRFSSDPNRRKNDKDFWLLKINELPSDSIQAGIFVRGDDNKITRQQPTRFRARYKYGERFLWDFVDGTTSTEEQPLKTYDISGMYDVKLTVFVNENCQETIILNPPLEVW